MCAQSLKKHPTLFDLKDCSPTGSFVHGIFQARILRWAAISFSRGFSRSGDQTTCPVSPAWRQVCYRWATWEASGQGRVVYAAPGGCCRSVAKPGPALCDLMDSTRQTSPSFAVSWSLLKLMSQWCDPTISSSVFSFSSCPQPFPASGSFPMSCLFTSGGQSTGASASVLPMDSQGWFLLGLTGLIFSLSKGLSRVAAARTTICWPPENGCY